VSIKVETPAVVVEQKDTKVSASDTPETPEPIAVPKVAIDPNSPKISGLSIASIKAKRDFLEQQKGVVKEVVHLEEPFSEMDMLEHWYKYIQRLEDKGQKIMASLLTIGDPVLEGSTLVHQLPNESSKLDFERDQHDLVGYLRGKLHNHAIQIKVIVNENVKPKKAFTSIDKYNRLKELNPDIELLKNMFDLDI
jgi:hypothetical protein